MQISMRDIAQIWRKMFGRVNNYTVLVSLYTNVRPQNAVIDQSEWSIPESRVIVCGWLYIIAYIMLLWLISNKQQGLCTTRVSKTGIQLRHDAPSPSHLICFLSCRSEML